MGREKEESLLSFTGELLHVKTSLSVTWYGGEPLLELETIDRLSQGVLELSSAERASYYARIVTNGYLPTRVTVERLLGLAVREA